MWPKGVSGNPNGRKRLDRVLTGTSFCPRCKLTKPAADFPGSSRYKDGCQSYCTKCKMVLTADWRARNPNAVRAYSLEYRQRDPAYYLHGRLRQRALKAGIPFDLTLDGVRELLSAAPVCPVLGIELVFSLGAGSGGRDNSPSFDRFIPELGYVPGNVSVMSNRANRIKQDATLDELRQLVTWMENRTLARELA